MSITPPADPPGIGTDPLARRLRVAGCVFAVQEAAVLRGSASDSRELEAWCTRRIAGEPLEHIVGWVGFGDRRLVVGPGVFVPRQRSLLLAHATVAVAGNLADPVVLEAYAGVGPIAACVRRALPQSAVHVSDVDEVALGYARQNVGTDAGVHLGAGFTALPGALRGVIDVIAAVPPYVPTLAAEFMPKEALYHEPGRAVFAGVDGLDHVRQLIARSPEWLAAEGTLLIEMNRDQYTEAAGYATRIGFRVSRETGEDGQTTVLVLRT